LQNLFSLAYLILLKNCCLFSIFNIFQKTPKRIFKLLYDVASEIIQKPKKVVLAFMHILHLKKMCARLLCMQYCGYCRLLSMLQCMHWLAVVSLPHCNENPIYVFLFWKLWKLGLWPRNSLFGILVSNFRYWFFAVHLCNVVYAVFWLLPFAYKAAVYAGWLRRALYLTQYMATWLYCLQRDGLGHQSNDTACHACFKC
jgi:hypothetical protein